MNFFCHIIFLVPGDGIIFDFFFSILLLNPLGLSGYYCSSKYRLVIFFGMHISSLISCSLIFYPIRSLEIFDPKRTVEEKYFKESFLCVYVKVN